MREKKIYRKWMHASKEEIEEEEELDKNRSRTRKTKCEKAENTFNKNSDEKWYEMQLSR